MSTSVYPGAYTGFFNCNWGVLKLDRDRDAAPALKKSLSGGPGGGGGGGGL